MSRCRCGVMKTSSETDEANEQLNRKEHIVRRQLGKHDGISVIGVIINDFIILFICIYAQSILVQFRSQPGFVLSQGNISHCRLQQILFPPSHRHHFIMQITWTHSPTPYSAVKEVLLSSSLTRAELAVQRRGPALSLHVILLLLQLCRPLTLSDQIKIKRSGNPAQSSR